MKNYQVQSQVHAVTWFVQMFIQPVSGNLGAQDQQPKLLESI